MDIQVGNIAGSGGNQGGFAIMTACDEGGSAVEAGALGHGVFSAAILEVLGGAQDLSSMGFFEQVSRRTNELSLEHVNRPQHPAFRSGGGALPIFSASAGRRRILAVGVDSYDSPSICNLKYAEADAQAVHGAFVARGFDAALLLGSDGGYRAVIEKIEGMLDQMGDHDVFVVHFSGHGMTVENKHVLMLADSHFNRFFSPSGVLALSDLARAMKKARGSSFLMLDTHFNLRR